MIYVYLDKDNFIDGWASSEMDGSIKIKEEKLADEIKDNFRVYRYDSLTDDFVKDESKAIQEAKASAIFQFNVIGDKKNNDGFEFIVDNEKLIFQNNSANKGFLQKAYVLTSDDFLKIKESTLRFIDEDGNEITKTLNKTKIYELWLLSFLHEDNINKHLDTVLIPKIKNAKTIEELNSITWDEGEEVKSRPMFF